MRRRVWPRTLRWRLQAWQGFLSLCMITGFGFVSFELQDNNRIRRIDEDLQTPVTQLNRIMRQALRPPPPPGSPDFQEQTGGRGRGHPAGHRPRPPVSRFPPDRGPGASPREVKLSREAAALFGSEPSVYYFVIWSADGDVLNRSANAPADSPVPPALSRDTALHLRTRGIYREAIHCSGPGDCAMVGRSIENDLRSSATLGWLVAAAGAAVLCIGIGVGWSLISRAIRPIGEIGEAATRVADGKFSERAPIRDPEDELGWLAAVLNTTFTRLEMAFARQQQFTSDAAHELRTPLAVLINEAQTTLARPRAAEEYKQALEGCLDTAQQMRRLTGTLLDLSRLDNASDSKRSLLDLAEISARCVQRLETLATRYGVAMLCELRPARICAVPERMEMVVMNLLSNAIAYNRPTGEVRIATGVDVGNATVRITDFGIGITRADLPHIFERFYRADKARSRADGHAGLGLSICKSILDAEGGTIEAESEFGVGSTFTVRIPVSG